MPVLVHTFSAFSDNFGFLLHDTHSKNTAAIDAGDYDATRKALSNKEWTLTHIFITHHDWDHTDAIMPLKEQFDLKVFGPAAEADKIHGLDVKLAHGDITELGSTRLQAIHTPGHTLGHLCYFDINDRRLFSGDALFSLGCGRMFEGTPAPMWEGLKRLRELPDETKVYCGHEYSQANADFAISIDPDNKILRERADQIKSLRQNKEPTIPFELGQDKLANPFLRADAPELAKKMGMTGADPANVFAAIRKAKDNF